MNHPIRLMIVAMAILAFATLWLVIVPAIEIDAEPPTPGLNPYSPQELRGRAQYVALGCMYCHSQQPRSPDQAPDPGRGWGRAAVASDYVYDQPHQLGTMRTGPDLQNIGARLPSRDWHLTHLYQPRAIVDWSIMPAYPFLFRHKPMPAAGDVVVVLPPRYAPPTGVVVAKPEALDLVRYLQALDRRFPAPPDAVRDQGYARREIRP